MEGFRLTRLDGYSDSNEGVEEEDMPISDLFCCIEGFRVKETVSIKKEE